MSSWLFPVGLKPSPAKKERLPYADIYARAIAATIDLGLLFYALNDLFYVWSQRLYRQVDQQMLQQAEHARGMEMLHLLVASHALPIFLLNSMVQIAVLGIIVVGVQMVWFNTPGKWLLGLQIVDAKTMQKPARWRFVVRFFGYLIAALPLMVGIMWATFNKQRRGWQDYMAGTVVIHTRGWEWYKRQGVRLYAKLSGRKEA